MKKEKLNLKKLRVSSFVTSNEDFKADTVKGGVLHQNPSITDCGSVFCFTNGPLLCPTNFNCPPEDC